MINEKIEEAAKMYAFHKCDERDIDQYDLSYLLENAFKAGINWFLDNLWHDVDERPDKKKIILCEFIDKINNTLVYTDIDLKVDYQAYKSNIDAMRITRWLYIDDLLKGGSHE